MPDFNPRTLFWLETEIWPPPRGPVTRRLGIFLCFEICHGSMELYHFHDDTRKPPSWFGAVDKPAPGEAAQHWTALRAGPQQDASELASDELKLTALPCNVKDWCKDAQRVARLLEIEIPDSLRGGEFITYDASIIYDAIEDALAAANEGLFFHPVYGVCLN